MAYHVANESHLSMKLYVCHRKDASGDNEEMWVYWFPWKMPLPDDVYDTVHEHPLFIFTKSALLGEK
jgi:hypothetical protein